MGSTGRFLAPLIALIKVLADWRFIAIAALIGGAIALAAMTGKNASPRLRRLGIAMGIHGFVNIMFGPDITDRLIYRFGTAGAATITDSYATSTQYNNNDVAGYHLLIRTREGQVIPTGFKDDDFNVYPPHDARTLSSEIRPPKAPMRYDATVVEHEASLMDFFDSNGQRNGAGVLGIDRARETQSG